MSRLKFPIYLSQTIHLWEVESIYLFKNEFLNKQTIYTLKILKP
jgi:hypothetical protein